jgi:hypothetical protein
LWERRFFISWQTGSREQSRDWTGIRYNFHRHIPSYLFPSTRPHVLKDSRSSPNSTTSWGPSIQHVNQWGMVHFQTITMM